MNLAPTYLPRKLGALAIALANRYSEALSERQLWAAVLLEAVECRIKDGPLGEEAREWFNSPSSEPFTFLWVCSVLDLDPDYVLRGAATYTKQTRFHPVTTPSPTSRQLDERRVGSSVSRIRGHVLSQHRAVG